MSSALSGNAAKAYFVTMPMDLNRMQAIDLFAAKRFFSAAGYMILKYSRLNPKMDVSPYATRDYTVLTVHFTSVALKIE